LKREDNTLYAFKRNAIPKEVYNRCVWLVRDYDRMKNLVMTAEISGQINLGKVSKSREVTLIADDSEWLFPLDVVRQAKSDVECVDRALLVVPEELRPGLLDMVSHRGKTNDAAHENTWKRWKKRFIYELAEELRLV